MSSGLISAPNGSVRDVKTKRYRDRGTPRERATVYLPEHQLSQLDQMAGESESSRSAVLEALLEDVLHRQPQKVSP